MNRFNFGKVWLIARREYLYNIRRRAVLFTLFVVPIFSFALTGIASSTANQSATDKGSYTQIGVVDLTPNHLMNTVPLPAPYMLIDQTSAANTLKTGSLDLYYLVPANYLTTGNLESYSRASIPVGRDDDFQQVIRQELAATSSHADPAIARRLGDPLPKVDYMRAGDTHHYSGDVLAFGSFLIPLIFGMLIFLSVNTTSQFLMSGVAEEKENRIMEVLMTSVRPSEMLWGKLIGMGALGLTQLGVWALLGIVIFSASGTLQIGDLLAQIQITPTLLFSVIAYFLLGYLFYGAIMAALGAISNSEQEGRQIAGIITMLAILPFILFFLFLTDPNGTWPIVLSMIPFTAPLAMIMRETTGAVPTLQIAASLLILLLCTILVIGFAARVFRLGMLHYSGKLRLRRLIRAMREGRTVLTTATEPAQQGGGS